MSKAEGKKIGIKFTLPLVGDVEDNENAFTVSGQEYQYTDDPDNNGPLLDKEYQVDKVERYPIQIVWALGEELKLESQIIGYTDDLTPKMTSNNAPSGEVTFSRQNNDDGNAAYRVFDKDNETRWSTSASPSFPYGWVAYEFPSKRNICKYTIKAHLTNGSSAPKNWAFEGWDGANYVILDEQNDINFSNGEYKEFTFNNNSYYIKYRLNVSLNGGAAFLGIAELELMGGIYEFTTPQKYTSQPIAIEGEYRLRWTENKPTGTDITIEYTTGQTQGEWIEVSNGDVITSDTNLWFRVTLETTDTSITSTLQDLWIEEPNAPNDQIRLVMSDTFRNVQGNVTINYNQAMGNLSGTGGAVASFTETFTPTDLEEGLTATGGAYGIHEHIEASVGGSIEMIYITKLDAYHPVEYIKASVGGSIDLKHISEINP